MIFLIWLIVFPHENVSSMRAEIFVSVLFICPPHLEQCLAFRKCSVQTCQMNGWVMTTVLIPVTPKVSTCPRFPFPQSKGGSHTNLPYSLCRVTRKAQSSLAWHPGRPVTMLMTTYMKEKPCGFVIHCGGGGGGVGGQPCLREQAAGARLCESELQDQHSLAL